jgi:hypothetical protein
MKLRPFFLKLFLYLLPIASCLLYLEYKLSGIHNSYNTKRYNLEQQLDSIEVITLGASHVAFGINPTYFSHRGFNLANMDQDLYFNYSLLVKYLPRLTHLKLVIIDADYAILHYSLENSSEYWRTYYYYKFWGVRSMNWHPLDINNYSLFALYSNSTVMELAKNRFKTNLAQSMHYNGWMKLDTLVNNDKIGEEQGKKRVGILNSDMNGDSKKLRKYFELLVSELRAKKIETEIISMPVLATYSKYCNKTILLEKTLFIDSLCTKYGCHFTNYFNDPRFVTADFNDNDHLNFIGALKFSRILDSDIIKPIHN